MDKSGKSLDKFNTNDKQCYNYVGENDNIICETFLDIIKDFNKQIEINNYLINEKIKEKLIIINHLIYNGFTVLNYCENINKKILSKLEKINSDKGILVYKDEINALLGQIIHNMYQYSGYQVLLSNVPEYGIIYGKNEYTKNEYIKIDNTVIFDTMEDYSNSDIIKVFQVSNGRFLIQFKDYIKAKEICRLLNSTIIGKNTIRVEYIEPKGKNVLSNDINKSISNLLASIEQSNNMVITNIFNNTISSIYSIYSNLKNNVCNSIYNGVKYGTLNKYIK